MVIVDTNVIVAAIRDNDFAKNILSRFSKHGIYISIITEMELNIGATNATKKQL